MKDTTSPARDEMAAIKKAARAYRTLDAFRSYINGRCGRDRRLLWDQEGLINEWYEQYRG
jgi:hypothetical protein